MTSIYLRICKCSNLLKRNAVDPISVLNSVDLQKYKNNNLRGHSTLSFVEKKKQQKFEFQTKHDH